MPNFNASVQQLLQNPDVLKAYREASADLANSKRASHGEGVTFGIGGSGDNTVKIKSEQVYKGVERRG